MTATDTYDHAAHMRTVYAKEIAQQEAVATTMRQVAPLLGEGWRYNAPTSDYGYHDGGCFVGPNGEELHISISTYGADAGRLTVSGVYGNLDGYEGRYHAPRDYTRVGISSTKAPKAIAADITRRLLPTYGETLETVRAAIAQTQQRAALTAANGARLGAILGKPGRVGQGGEHEFSVSQYGNLYGGITVSGAHVSAKLSNLTIDQAEAIARIIVAPK
jgi:hypothetical protein